MYHIMSSILRDVLYREVVGNSVPAFVHLHGYK